jgi:hypothetical protein
LNNNKTPHRYYLDTGTLKQMEDLCDKVKILGRYIIMVLVFKDDPEIYIVVLVNEGLTQKLRI